MSGASRPRSIFEMGAGQVYPEGRLERLVLDGLDRHPRLIVIWNPFYETWQVYERPRQGVSDWNARRLYEAVVRDHERASAYEGSDEYVPGMKVPGNPWWKEKGAPYCLDDDLGVQPGPWFLKWAEQREASRINIRPTDWWNLMEAIEGKRKEESKRALHDKNLAVAEDIGKSVAEGMPHGLSKTDALKKIRRQHGEAEIKY